PTRTAFSLGHARVRPPVNFGSLVELQAAGLSPSIDGRASLAMNLDKAQAYSGQDLMIDLKWRLSRATARDYKASLYLTDANGHRGGQVDLLLHHGQASTNRWKVGESATNYYVLPTVPGLLPGTYNLNLAVYPSGGTRRLSVLDKAGAASGASTTLGQVRILPPLSPVNPSQLGIQHTLQAPVVQGIQLLGFDLPGKPVLQGQPLPLILFWRAVAPSAANLKTELSLTRPGSSGDGQAAWRWSSAPAFPTSQWKPGDAFRDWYQPRLPSDLAPGPYEVRVGMGGSLVPIGTVQVQQRQRSFALPYPEHPLQATIGAHIRLLGYDLDRPTYAPGDKVRLTLYWRASGAMRKSYTAFAHVLDAGRRVVAQRDTIPVHGTVPTNSWLPGQVVTDVSTLDLPANLSPGSYQLETGFYSADTGVRLAASSPSLEIIDNGILLGSLKVKR
ncbi:MAG: hypothetical protein ACYDAG_12740, partial [Chloroflexota bacterium]